MGFIITNEAVAAMYQYCAVPDGIVKDLDKSIKKLLSAYEENKSGLVPDHVNGILNILNDLADMLNTISDDAGSTYTYVKKMAEDYQKTLVKTIGSRKR